MSKQNPYNSRKGIRQNKQKDALWDDLFRIHQECCAVSTSPAVVLPLLRDPERLARVKDTKLLNDKARVLANDAKAYSERLSSILDKHRDRRGGSIDPSDYMTAISIGEEYSNWLQSYQVVVLPMVNEISAMFAGTEAVSNE